MNDKLLLHHIINFPLQDKYIKFLNYIHPNYSIVENIDEYDNYNPTGIIYTGKFNDNIVKQLSSLTDNWIIINNKYYDLDLTTNEGLIKNILPIQYFKIKSSLKYGDIAVYNKISYDNLIEQIKLCLISNNSISADDETDSSVYSLFSALLCTPNVLANQYFNIVNKNNISLITSSILTFLTKVQSKNTIGASPNYTRLILQSHTKYGKRIKQGISQFVKSKANKEIALYNLLSFLNKAR